MDRHTVAEVMTSEVVTVRESTGYKDVVASLAGWAISAVPVVDDAHRVLGVVSEGDLMHKLQIAGGERHGDLVGPRRTWVAQAKAAATTARELMSAPAVTVSAAMSLTAAARLMDGHDVTVLPVVDDQERLLGIVTRADLLRPFLRADDDIRREVRDEVILRTMWLNPDTIDVGVVDGVVTLDGTVERLGTVPVLVELVHSVAGVVDVVDHLRPRSEDLAGRTLATIS